MTQPDLRPYSPKDQIMTGSKHLAHEIITAVSGSYRHRTVSLGPITINPRCGADPWKGVWVWDVEGNKYPTVYLLIQPSTRVTAIRASSGHDGSGSTPDTHVTRLS